MVQFELNGTHLALEVDPEKPLLWALREELRLSGTKFGCGEGLCGTCTVHIDGVASRSCLTPMSAVAGRKVTTIEGLSSGGSHPVQRAWLEAQVTQCGYCQPGQIMAASALLARTPKPTDADIDAALAGNICRCGTYPRIRQAVHRAAQLIAAEG